MSSTKLELNALNKSDDITLYHDNFTAEKASQNNGTQDSSKYENKSDMSSQQSSDLHCQTLDKEEKKQNNKGQLFKLMTSGEISDKFNEKQFEETKEKTGFFSNETSKESKPPVVLFTEIQKNENKNSFGKSDTESRNYLTEHDYPIHTTENNDQIIKQAESLNETLLLPNLDGQYIKPERSQIVDGPQVHFASPLFVYHEYTISECSSRTETMDSDSSMEIPELEIRSDESCTENKRRDINNAPITVLEESMELSTITHKFEEISDTSMKVSEDDVHSAMCSDKFENKSTGNTSVTISKHTVMPLIYSDKLSKGRVQVVPISSCENQMVNDSECLILSNDSSQEDKIISEVRNILENLIVQCCDINDEFYKNDFEVKCTTEPNCTLAMLDVSFEENGLSQFSQYEKKELETFSDLNGQETRQVITKDFTKFDIDELDETILLNSNQQQSSDDINFENSVLEELSSTANCKLVVIELKPSVNSETENNISQMGDLANISNIPNYSDKAKILKEENEEKVNKILSPKCLQSMCKIEESEIEMSSCDNQVTSTSSHSQQHDEEQSNSQFQVFDSENESTESQTEMNESCVHMEKIKPLNRLNDKTNSQKYILHENLDISEREASVDQCIINFDNPRKGDGDLNNNKSDVQELCTEAPKEGDNCYSISIKEVEQSNNVTMEIADASESLKIDHEQTCNGNDEHLDQKQNILKEFPVDFTDRKQKSDLIDDVRVDDTTSIEISTNVLKNYILDKDQESNVPITEIDIEFNDLSNSKNQQQEFNPCFESSESIVINKQLDLHLNAVMEDANLQVQESSSINQNDEESLIKVKENHLSLNYLQNSLTKGRLDRKRSVKETGIEDEKPSAKVSVYHSISEGLDQYKYAEVRLVDKEGIQHEDGTLPEPVDIKITEELHYNDKIKECCAKEQMDQTVPDESDCGIKLATETLYSQHMDKKEDTDICILEMKGDDISILPEMSGDYICREKYDFVDNSMVQAFKWKYVPSIDLDSVVPNCDGENEANPLLPAPIKTCKKPYRLGLSKRQKLSSLHPKLKRV